MSSFLCPRSCDAAVRLIVQKEVAAAARQIFANAYMWQTCFGSTAKGSLRDRERRALRLASTQALLAFLDSD